LIPLDCCKNAVFDAKKPTKTKQNKTKTHSGQWDEGYQLLSPSKQCFSQFESELISLMI
jgi:hypothetical protein